MLLCIVQLRDASLEAVPFRVTDAPAEEMASTLGRSAPALATGARFAGPVTCISSSA